uniref:Glutaredoxin domain-containing protein n=1 Tax=Plectus sambesii TaxID=2011161 RepID=A0A914UP94_9BILA
ELNKRLEKLIKQSRCVLFMKGNPDEPRCGFSRQTVQLLNDVGADYTTFDILSDEAVRQGLKEYSQWPTFPQIYLDGELLGGLDIVREELESGDLAAKLPKKVSLNNRLKSLINKAPIMVFMKGEPSQPQCKFSRALMEIFTDMNVKFDHFNILSDNDVREGLKEYSKWPSYPQIYVKGELVGGLDIIKELKESGELAQTLSVD